MVIRDFCEEDLPGLLPLYEELGYAIEAETLRRQLTALSHHPDYGLLIAVHENQILGLAGYARLLFFEREGCYVRLLILVVAEQVRRQGIAHKLLDAVRNRAEQAGAKVLAVSSGLGEQRQAAHAFYRNYGFVQHSLGFGLDL